ncbi:hypothetical protein DdX_14110 [Ditylenchus destructor]|uniref:Uncharacterized protein n=1 Tax=Ditylenchus destructor TaxID=166010 RepID=A0AAD4MTY7_9BILA|nr:hypothetical protein DdX_14110 [Ditylenchus destructor]
MAQTPFFCDECHMDLDDSNVRNHISVMHLNYFPFKCFACKRKGINHETLTKEQMFEHTSNVHVGNVMDVRLFMDREDELNAAVENCRRPSAEQVSLNDSKHAMRQVFIALGDTLTDSRNNSIENEVTSTEIKQESDNVEVHESTTNDNIGEDTELNVQHNSVVAATGRAPRRKRNNISRNLVGSPERSHPKRNLLDVQNTTKELMAEIKSCENRVKKLEEKYAKRRRESLKMKQSAGPASDASSLPAQRSSEMHQISANNLNGNKNENGECYTMDKRERHIDRFTFGLNLTAPSARSGEAPERQQLCKFIHFYRDRFLKPTTSAQAVLDVPNDPAQKMKVAIEKIKSIWINISSGSARFETSTGLMYDCRRCRPLCNICQHCQHMSNLRQSEADVRGCVAHISYYTYEGDGHESIQKKFEKFSRDFHSIARLWANGRVEADFREYDSKVLPVSDFCDGLFSQDRSILACNQLEIQLANNWPFSVVTNAAHHCNQLILKETRRDQRLHYRLLDALYERKIPQHVEVTLNLCFKVCTNEFLEELNKRFRRSKEQNFKLTLLFPKWAHPDTRGMRNEHGLWLTTTTQTSPKEDRDSVMIVQHTLSEADNLD